MYKPVLLSFLSLLRVFDPTWAWPNVAGFASGDTEKDVGSNVQERYTPAGHMR